jgi:hypothetical protein
LCCRKDSGDEDREGKKSRKYGEDACDLPNATFDTFISEIYKQQPDIIFWIGDNAPNNNTPREAHNKTSHFKFIANKILEIGWTSIFSIRNT